MSFTLTRDALATLAVAVPAARKQSLMLLAGFEHLGRPRRRGADPILTTVAVNTARLLKRLPGTYAFSPRRTPPRTLRELESRWGPADHRQSAGAMSVLMWWGIVCAELGPGDWLVVDLGASRLVNFHL